nr:hypothetical protein CFP56_04576 [Quercus suber]
MWQTWKGPGGPGTIKVSRRVPRHAGWTSPESHGIGSPQECVSKGDVTAAAPQPMDDLRFAIELRKSFELPRAMSCKCIRSTFHCIGNSARPRPCMEGSLRPAEFRLSGGIELFDCIETPSRAPGSLQA